MPTALAATLSWVGVSAIIGSAFIFTPRTSFPGSLVAVPVLATAAVIAGGAAAPRFGVESLLRRGVFRFFGDISYSLYLWHYPIVILSAYALGAHAQDGDVKIALLLGAVVVSRVTYRFIEHPVRRWRLMPTRALRLGLATVVATVAVFAASIVISK
jgi:peptidoglycan/LPS O-acetylase OafA/YrhL